MKKMVFIIFILTLIRLPMPVYSAEGVVQSVYDDAMSRVSEINVTHFNFREAADHVLAGDVSSFFNILKENVKTLLLGETKENTTLLLKILVLSVLAGVFCNLQERSRIINEISFLACCSIIASLSISMVTTMTELATETINQLKLMMLSFLPILSSLTISTKQGAFLNFYPSLFFSMQGFIAICNQVFIPINTTIAVLSVVNTMSTRFHISRLIDVAKQSIKWGLGILLTVFVGVLSVHGFTASTAGTITGRTVKYALCNFIPLVGNTLSESIEAVVSSVRLIKGALGLTGVIALLSLCVVPLLKMLIISFLYRLAAGFSEPATDKRIVKLLMDFADNITLTFVILLMVSVMFIISIALLCGLFF